MVKCRADQFYTIAGRGGSPALQAQPTVRVGWMVLAEEKRMQKASKLVLPNKKLVLFPMKFHSLPMNRFTRIYCMDLSPTGLLQVSRRGV